MIARKVCVLLVLTIVVWCVDSISLGSPCTIRSNNVQGICIVIKECPSIWDLYQRGAIRTNPPTVCSTADRSVCCPTVEVAAASAVVTTTIEPPRKMRISEQKCKEYAQHVFRNVTIPAVVFGDTAMIKKVDKCMYKSVPLIVGGESVKEGEFPHMAMLGYADGEPQDFACGGSLLSPQFVLTAAHCLYPRGYGAVKFVKLGAINRTQSDNNSFVFNVKEIFQHPSYDPKKLNNDLGLLKLDALVPLSERILPICLPQKFIAPEKAVATGFGRTGQGESGSKELLKVTLERFTQAECQQPFGKAVTITNDTMICYGHHSERKDSCNGDSGGPLQVYNTETYCTYSQIGLVSFGLKKCGTIGAAGAYANVFHYLDWIERVVWG